MKYIRTKDGRIKKVRDGFESKEWENSDEYFYSHYHSKADTIEELCDEFVLIRNGIIRVYPKKHLLEESITGYCMGDEVYGAIWTSKGLIYVAKMNDKGELELL